MLGGPLGAIIGGALGSNVGDTNGGRRVHPGARVNGQRRGYSPLQAQQTFMIAMISLAAKVAKADGTVTPAEVRSFDDFLWNQLGMGSQERRMAARIFNEARDSQVPAEEFARQIRDLLSHDRGRLRDLVSLLMSIAMADGRYHATEERIIRNIAREMGLSINFEHAIVKIPEDAIAHRHIGSPTVQINGLDIDTGAREVSQFGVT